MQIDCSDETLSERLRLKSIQEKYSSQDRRMEYSHCSLSGMMSRLLEPIIRIRESTSKDLNQSESGYASQEDSPVRISQSQEKEPDWKERAQAYGMRCGGLLARFDQDSYSWKTAQCLLFEDSTECLGTLPNWGSLHGMELSELMLQERPIEGSDSGYGENGKRWPTPVSSDRNGAVSERAWGGYSKRMKMKRASKLSNAVVFPTPGTTGLSNGSGNCEKANDLFAKGVITEEERRNFRAGNGGQLNPDWVEWLMGWPIGWTSLKPIDSISCQEWKEQADKGALWSKDPADLPPASMGYIPRITNDKTHRRERLKALGNGQVPSCACLSEMILQKDLYTRKTANEMTVKE